MVSQRSFVTRQSRFVSAVEILKANADYKPNKGIITPLVLENFALELGAKNGAVGTSLEALTNVRDLRLNIAYNRKGSDINNIENRIKQILAYIKAEFGEGTSVHKMVYKISQKLSPQYEKREEGRARGSGKSPSEKSFASLAGYAKQVLAYIESLGSEYHPQNQAIQVNNFKAIVEQLEQLNKQVAIVLKDYGDIVRDRAAAFDGKEGLTDRIDLIRAYLSSFEGGRRNTEYIEFNQALRGI
jgi:hypothetical protein